MWTFKIRCTPRVDLKRKETCPLGFVGDALPFERMRRRNVHRNWSMQIFLYYFVRVISSVRFDCSWKVSLSSVFARLFGEIGDTVEFGLNSIEIISWRYRRTGRSAFGYGTDEHFHRVFIASPARVY